MKKYLLILLLFFASCATQSIQAPIPIHPENPYLLLIKIEKDFPTTRQLLQPQFPESEWYYYYNPSTQTVILIKKKNPPYD